MAGNNSSLMKVVLLGGAGYLAYRWLFAAPSTSAGAGSAPAPGAAPPVPPVGPLYVAPPPPPKNDFNSLASVFDRIKQAGGSGSQSPDTWNFIAAAQGAPGPLPDPDSLFGSHDPVTLAQYWAAMSGWLATNKGLSGLAVYAGLGRLAGVFSRRPASGAWAN